MTVKIDTAPSVCATHSFIGYIAAYIVQTRDLWKPLLALFQSRETSSYTFIHASSSTDQRFWPENCLEGEVNV